MTEGMIEVCAAVIKHGSRFLLARRPPGSHLAGLWEFPGGKVHEGETLEECIRREIMEELGRDIVVGDRIATIEHWYPEKCVRLHFFACRLTGCSTAVAVDGAVEHSWFTQAAAGRLDLAPADRRFAETELW